ncbi:MAG: glycosyltransferase [Macellibacteroides fermentans]|uniref:glycosyltransferase n=1 Tax=Macellibacteroides fermentans TaxID=879969 RepID=UPI003ACE720A
MQACQLSIIIPTRNRYETLIPVVHAINSNIIGNSYEIVIQDNSDNNEEMLDYLKSNFHNSIKYFYTDQPISMVENTELALSHAEGNYWTFIGDDDIVSPYILKIIELMDYNKVNCLSYAIGNYFYTDLTFNKQYGFNNPATLQVTNQPSLDFKELFCENELEKVLNIGGVYCLKLPRLYHGVVKKELMLKIKDKYGQFIPGPCPDMTLSIALALQINNYHYIEYPVTITGSSRKSEGGKGVSQKHIVEVKNKEWLSKNVEQEWSPKIPKIFTRETIWAQSIFHVLNVSRIEKSINYLKLYENMYFSCPDFVLQYINNTIKENKINIHISQIIKWKSKRIIRKLLFKCPSICLEFVMHIRGDYKKYLKIDNLKTIDACIIYLKNYKVI